jgi:hypothetical protein
MYLNGPTIERFSMYRVTSFRSADRSVVAACWCCVA